MRSAVSRQFRRARSLPSKPRCCHHRHGGSGVSPTARRQAPVLGDPAVAVGVVVGAGWRAAAVSPPSTGRARNQPPNAQQECQLRRRPSIRPSRAEPSGKRVFPGQREPWNGAGLAGGCSSAGRRVMEMGHTRDTIPPGMAGFTKARMPIGQSPSSTAEDPMSPPTMALGALVGTHPQCQPQVGKVLWPATAAHPLLNKITDAGVSVCNSLSTRILLGRRSSGGTGTPVSWAPPTPRNPNSSPAPPLPRVPAQPYLWM